jgi:hypothetical protein
VAVVECTVRLTRWVRNFLKSAVRGFAHFFQKVLYVSPIPVGSTRDPRLQRLPVQSLQVQVPTPGNVRRRLFPEAEGSQMVKEGHLLSMSMPEAEGNQMVEGVSMPEAEGSQMMPALLLHEPKTPMEALEMPVPGHRISASPQGIQGIQGTASPNSPMFSPTATETTPTRVLTKAGEAAIQREEAAKIKKVRRTF